MLGVSVVFAVAQEREIRKVRLVAGMTKFMPPQNHDSSNQEHARHP